jgi:hypothetical protein
LALRLEWRLPVSVAPLLTTIMVNTMMTVVVAGHTHHGGWWHVHAPASFGRAFSISLITALVGGPGVYGCFGKSSGRLQETGGRVGRPSLIALGWLKMVVDAKRAGSPRGYSILAPYGAKKLVCGRSWCQCLDIGRFCAYAFGTMRFH